MTKLPPKASPQPSAVTIPHTPLGADIAIATQLQAEMLQLLRELEAAAGTAHPDLPLDPSRPGSWRHRRPS